MSIKVRIPQPLQKLTGGAELVEVSGSDVKSLIADLDKNFPGFKDRICDETGKVRRFINIYINDEDIRFLEGDTTKINDSDEVSIIPAIAGG
ncbi:MAG: MoaD/ThiS family protein [Candidatus Margulisiibacteriota bacterium]